MILSIPLWGAKHRIPNYTCQRSGYIAVSVITSSIGHDVLINNLCHLKYRQPNMTKNIIHVIQATVPQCTICYASTHTHKHFKWRDKKNFADNLTCHAHTHRRTMTWTFELIPALHGNCRLTADRRVLMNNVDLWGGFVWLTSVSCNLPVFKLVSIVQSNPFIMP